MARFIGWLCLFAVVVTFAQRPQARAAETPVLQVTCPTEAPLGQLFDCAIGSAGEADLYSFTGALNDKVFVSALRTSGDLDPYVVLSKPGGETACERYTYGDQLSFVCTLTATGTHTLRIADTRNLNTGGYAAYIQRLNNPGSATSIAFGPAISGSIGNRIQANTYSFTGLRNDIIRLRMLRTAGELDPYFSLYNAQGSLINECSSYTYGDLVVRECALSADGAYTLLLGDTSEDNTGDYQFHLQRLNNPGGANPLAFGTLINAGIDAGAEMDVYSFELTTNDQLMIHLARLSGDLDPQFELFNSAGTSVCDNYTYGNFTKDDDCAINASGRYTLMVDDSGNLNTGNYTLAVQRLNNPGAATPLAFNQSLSDSIDGVAVFRTYSFSTQQTAKIKLTVQRNAGTLALWVRVYTGAGLLLCQDYSFSASVTLENCTAPADGIYTVIVADSNDTAVGNYTLALGCAGGPCVAQAPQKKVYLPAVRK
jgi:hypothetical protein